MRSGSQQVSQVNRYPGPKGGISSVPAPLSEVQLVVDALRNRMGTEEIKISDLKLFLQALIHDAPGYVPFFPMFNIMLVIMGSLSAVRQIPRLFQPQTGFIYIDTKEDPQAISTSNQYVLVVTQERHAVIFEIIKQGENWYVTLFNRGNGIENLKKYFQTHYVGSAWSESEREHILYAPSTISMEIPLDNIEEVMDELNNILRSNSIDQLNEIYKLFLRKSYRLGPMDAVQDKPTCAVTCQMIALFKFYADINKLQEYHYIRWLIVLASKKALGIMECIGYRPFGRIGS